MQIWQCYKTLGVPGGATEEEIKKAHRELAAKYDPNKPDGDIKKFTEVNEAYKFLIQWLPQDEERRKGNPDEYIVRALLGIREEDSREQIKNKFGFFRMQYFSKKMDYTEEQMDTIGAVVLKMIGPATEAEEAERMLLELEFEKIEKAVANRKKILINIVTFLTFIIATILMAVLLWNTHPALGLLSLGLSLWLFNNKLQTGYYFGA